MIVADRTSERLAKPTALSSGGMTAERNAPAATRMEARSVRIRRTDTRRNKSCSCTWNQSDRGLRFSLAVSARSPHRGRRYHDASRTITDAGSTTAAPASSVPGEYATSASTCKSANSHQHTEEQISF